MAKQGKVEIEFIDGESKTYDDVTDFSVEDGVIEIGRGSDKTVYVALDNTRTCEVTGDV